jgi:hypothetical protein
MEEEKEENFSTIHDKALIENRLTALTYLVSSERERKNKSPRVVLHCGRGSTVPKHECVLHFKLLK